MESRQSTLKKDKEIQADIEIFKCTQYVLKDESKIVIIKDKEIQTSILGDEENWTLVEKEEWPQTAHQTLEPDNYDTANENKTSNNHVVLEYENLKVISTKEKECQTVQCDTESHSLCQTFINFDKACQTLEQTIIKHEKAIQIPEKYNKESQATLEIKKSSLIKVESEHGCQTAINIKEPILSPDNQNANQNSKNITESTTEFCNKNSKQDKQTFGRNENEEISEKDGKGIEKIVVDKVANEPEKTAADKVAKEIEKSAVDKTAIETEKSAADNVIKEIEKTKADKVAKETEKTEADKSAKETEKTEADKIAKETEKSAVDKTAIETEKPAADNVVKETEKPAADKVAKETENIETDNVAIESAKSEVDKTAIETEKSAADNVVKEIEKSAADNVVKEIEKSAADNVVKEAEKSAADKVAKEIEKTPDKVVKEMEKSIEKDKVKKISHKEGKEAEITTSKNAKAVEKQSSKDKKKVEKSAPEKVRKENVAEKDLKRIEKKDEKAIERDSKEEIKTIENVEKGRRKESGKTFEKDKEIEETSVKDKVKKASGKGRKEIENASLKDGKKLEKCIDTNLEKGSRKDEGVRKKTSKDTLGEIKDNKGVNKDVRKLQADQIIEDSSLSPKGESHDSSKSDAEVEFPMTFEECYHNKSPFLFNQFYESFCTELRESSLLDSIIKDFMEFNNDYDRVKYVINMEGVKKMKVKKLAEKNERFARLCEAEYDNLATTAGGFTKCLFFISKSLQLTPNEDEQALALRFMKRSWLYLLFEKFDLAEIDANRSLTYNTSLELMWNAYEILGHCYAKQNLYKKSETCFKSALEGLRSCDVSQEIKAATTKRISVVFKHVRGRYNIKSKKKAKDVEEKKIPSVSFGSNDTLESASNAVEVRVDDDTGRSLYATKDLRPGNILIIEKPYITSLNFAYFSTHCFNCFKRFDAPVPCYTCSYISFCDENCRSKSYNESHIEECKTMAYLYDPFIGSMAVLVFRILAKITWAKLKELRKQDLINTSLSDEEDAKKSKECPWKGKYSSEDYLTTYHLVTNSKKRKYGDIFKRAVSAVCIANCLKVGNFFKEEVSDEDFVFAASLALRHLQGTSCNAYGITECLYDDEALKKADILEVAGAIYPTISLSNHSCKPNVFRYNIGDVCIVRCIKTIKKGEQIFDAYGPIYETANLHERREILSQQYKFDCNCQACEEDWPLFGYNDIPFKFICPQPNCKQVSSYEKGKNKECPSCGKSERYSSFIKDATMYFDEFSKAKTLLYIGNVVKAFPIIQNHQMFLDKYAIPPAKCVSESTEFLKRCFLHEGNKFPTASSSTK